MLNILKIKPNVGRRRVYLKREKKATYFSHRRRLRALLLKMNNYIIYIKKKSTYSHLLCVLHFGICVALTDLMFSDVAHQMYIVEILEESLYVPLNKRYCIVL